MSILMEKSSIMFIFAGIWPGEKYMKQTEVSK